MKKFLLSFLAIAGLALAQSSTSESPTAISKGAKTGDLLADFSVPSGKAVTFKSGSNFVLSTGSSLSANGATISPAELGFLDNVDQNIKTFMTSTNTAIGQKAPINNPTFTGIADAPIVRVTTEFRFYDATSEVDAKLTVDDGVLSFIPRQPLGDNGRISFEGPSNGSSSATITAGVVTGNKIFLLPNANGTLITDTAPTFTATASISNAAPVLKFFESDGPSNKKKWQFQADDTVFSLKALSDSELVNSDLLIFNQGTPDGITSELTFQGDGQAALTSADGLERIQVSLYGPEIRSEMAVGISSPLVYLGYLNFTLDGSSGSGSVVETGDGPLIMRGFERTEVGQSGTNLKLDSSGMVINAPDGVTGTATTNLNPGVADKLVRTATGGYIDNSLIDSANLSVQFRRGTDAERSVGIPANGEAWWTTDTKKLWIGDGSTVGGLGVTPPGYNNYWGGGYNRIELKSNPDSLSLDDGDWLILSNDDSSVLRVSTTLDISAGSSGSGSLSLSAADTLSMESDALNISSGSLNIAGIGSSFIGTVTETGSNFTVYGSGALNLTADETDLTLRSNFGKVQIDGTSGATTEAKGLWLGNDVAIYRSAADFLSTNDTMVGGALRAASFKGGLWARSANPSMGIYETDAGADAKAWDILAASGSLLFRNVNDADNVGTAWLTVARSGTTPGSATFAGPLLSAGGTAVTSAASSTGFRVFNTSDQSTNYESLGAYFSGNTAYLTTQSGGTGTRRQLYVGDSGNAATTQIGGGFGAMTLRNTAPHMEFTRTLSNTTNLASFTATMTQTSGTNSVVAITPTYNQASGTAANTDLLISRTQTAVGSGAQYLARGEVGGETLFSIANTGELRTVRSTTSGNQYVSISGGDASGTYIRGNGGDKGTNFQNVSFTSATTVPDFTFAGGINGTPGAAFLSVSGGKTTLGASSLGGFGLSYSSFTTTDGTTAASGTATNRIAHGFQRPTIAATNASVTTTNAATLYVANSPAAGTNMTITNPYALWVDDGKVRFDGDLDVAGKIQATATASGAGFNVGSYAGHPSPLNNGDIWYDTSAGQYKTYRIGSVVGAIATENNTLTLSSKTINLANNTLTASSSQMATAVSDETGSGALVFGTSPTFTTSMTVPAAINGSGAVTIQTGGTNSDLILRSKGTGYTRMQSDMSDANNNAQMYLKTNSFGLDLMRNGGSQASISMYQSDYPYTAAHVSVQGTNGASLSSSVSPGGYFASVNVTPNDAGQIDLYVEDNNTIDRASQFKLVGYDSHLWANDFAIDVASFSGSGVTDVAGSSFGGKIALTNSEGNVNNLIDTANLSVQFRRGTDAERAVGIPANGEAWWSSDTQKLWIGDGATLGGIAAAPPGYTYTADDVNGVHQLNIGYPTSANIMIDETYHNMTIGYPISGPGLYLDPEVNSMRLVANGEAGTEGLYWAGDDPAWYLNTSGTLYLSAGTGFDISSNTGFDSQITVGNGGILGLVGDGGMNLTSDVGNIGIQSGVAVNVTAPQVTIEGALQQSTSTTSGTSTINPINKDVFLLTTTGASQAKTLSNGSAGQTIKIFHVVDGGSAVITPTTQTGFTSVTMANVGDCITLTYVSPTYGWMISSTYGAGVTVTP